MSDWILCEYRMPEDAEPVLVCVQATGCTPIVRDGYRFNGQWQGEMDSAVTHWRRLPEPPTEETS